MTNKWMTSGASRLKANLNRSFFARKNMKNKSAAATTNLVATTKKSTVTASSLSRKKNNVEGKQQRCISSNKTGRHLHNSAMTGKDSTLELGGPPSHFFTNSFKKHDANTIRLLPPQRNHAYTYDYDDTAAASEFELHRRGGIFPPPLTHSARAHHFPSHPFMMEEKLSSYKEENDDAASFRTETFERMIALQEALQARREYNAQQLLQLEIMEAMNQRKIEEEMIMKEQYHRMRSMQQLNYPPSFHVVEGDTERLPMSRLPQQLQCMPTNSGIQPRNSDRSSISSRAGGAMRRAQSTDVSSGRFPLPDARYFHHYKSPSRSNNEGLKTPPMRYWNRGVEVDIRGVPLNTAQSLSRHNSSSNSATSTTTAAVTTPSSASSSPENEDENIISQFSNLVMSCVPEVRLSVSNLLSEIELVRGYPSDPLIVHSKFPGFVGSTLMELMSLEERSKDDKELRERIYNCIAAIEPYKNVSELVEAGSVYSQIRAVVKEGTSRASALIMDDPSKDKKSRKKKRKDEKRDEGKPKRKKRSSSSSDTITITPNILEMYTKQNSKEDEVEVVNVDVSEPKPSLAETKASTSAMESSETSHFLKIDEGASNVAEVQRRNAPEKQVVSYSSSACCDNDTPTQPKAKDSSPERVSVQEHRISDQSNADANSKDNSQLQVNPKARFEDGPHSSLLRQIFGNGNGQ